MSITGIQLCKKNHKNKYEPEIAEHCHGKSNWSLAAARDQTLWLQIWHAIPHLFFLHLPLCSLVEKKGKGRQQLHSIKTQQFRGQVENGNKRQRKGSFTAVMRHSIWLINVSFTEISLQTLFTRKISQFITFSRLDFKTQPQKVAHSQHTLSPSFFFPKDGKTKPFSQIWQCYKIS